MRWPTRTFLLLLVMISHAHGEAPDRLFKIAFVDIFAVGERVMVLKRGEFVGDRYIKDTDEHKVIEIIVSARANTH